MNVYRGDIYYIQENNYVRGNNQPGKPVLVISSEARNLQKDGVTVVYLTTNMVEVSTTHVNVMCKVPCIALCERIVTYPVERLGEYVRTCTNDEMSRIDKALMWVLGMGDTPVETVVEVDKSAEKVKELEGALNAANSDAELYKAQLDAQIAANEQLQAMVSKYEANAAAPDTRQIEETILKGIEAGAAYNSAREENIRLKAEIEVYKGMIGKLIPQLA